MSAQVDALTSKSEAELVSVQVNLESVVKVFQNQNIPLFVGIVGAFALAALFLVLGLLPGMKVYFTTFMILAAGFLILFINFVLVYVDTSKRINDVKDRLDNARVNAYSGAQDLDCPAFFERAQAADGTFKCNNVNGIGDASGSAPYAAVLPTGSKNLLYPYEAAFGNLTHTTVGTAVS